MATKKKFPSYNKNKHQGLYNELRKEVHATIGTHRHRANTSAITKGLFLLFTFLGSLGLYWSFAGQVIPFFAFSIILGLLCLPLVLNIGHESVHGNFTDNRRINQAAKWAFFLLGTSDYFWQLRHNNAHHAYANIADLDLDIEQSKIIRLSPKQPFQKRHKYQHWYMPFVFLFYTLIWFFHRDFKDIGIHQFGKKHIVRHPPAQLIKLFGAKFVHLAVLIGLPYYFSQDISTTLMGFFLFHLSASVLTTFALISTHVGENQEVVFTDDNQLPYSWYEHQFRTTADFSTESTIITHFFGGFNHHLAHHLFPNIPHFYYPLITPIIKRHAQENDIEYHEYSNLAESAASHIRRLSTLSKNTLLKPIQI